MTLTVAAPKIGLLAPGAAEYTGAVEVITEVGLVPCPHQTELRWTLPEDFVGYPPRRPADTHKGALGHLFVLAGGLGYQGAAVLAARGAQRARPGLITLQTQEATFPLVASQLQSVMVRPWDLDRLAEGTALLAGPGLASPESEAALKAPLRKLWLHLDQPVVVDASALDWISLGATITQAPRILTPHPGEAGRLINGNADYVQADRLRALRQTSSRFSDCWVVLKGHQTLIGRSSGEVYVNGSGNPGLAQGGSGDLLAGYIAGLLAQPTLAGDPLTALRYAVWQHGAAADLLTVSQPNWTVEDLGQQLGIANPADFPLQAHHP
jgi:NAD(P)H-hydrate epimerase